MNRHHRQVCAVLAVAWLAGCGARTTDEQIDGQSHWLTECETDATCGAASCLCGVCTSECETDADCWSHDSTLASRCAGGEPFGCTAAPRVCVPDCAGDACITRASTRPAPGDEELPERLTFASTSVPECPAQAPRVGLQLASVRTAVVDYDGPATVTAVQSVDAEQHVSLDFDELPGGQATVVLRGIPAPLATGSRPRALVKSGGSGNNEYSFIALRDDSGALLLAAHDGADDLYQEGWFASPDAVGATVEIRMTCQSEVDIEDGCFEHQVQADYEATFRADDSVTTDGATYETLSIDGRTHSVSFWGSSIGGEEPLCDERPTRRYLSFALVVQ